MWQNWARNQRCAPSRVLHPGSAEEVAIAVRAAAREGQRVRVAGAGHSFTAGCCTDGVQLSLDRLHDVLAVDPRRGLARVHTGITLRVLNLALAAHGLALPTQGEIDTQTLGGALATGFHGTGAMLSTLAAQVVELRLVDGRGNRRHLDSSTPDLLRAARVSLGALGVITDVTLRCVPAVTLQMAQAPAPLDRVLAGLDARVDAHRHLEVQAFPHSRSALVRVADVTDQPARPRSASRAWLQDVLLENYGLELCCRAGRRRPRLAPQLNWIASRLAGSRATVDLSHRVLPAPRLMRFLELEYAVPRAAGAELLHAALRVAQIARVAITLPVRLRFSAGDDAPLSPAHGRDTAWVAVRTYRGIDHEQFFAMVEEAALRLGGRPHWATLHSLDAARIAERYPEWDVFQRARAELDPDGTFSNEHTEAMLGPLPLREATGLATP